MAITEFTIRQLADHDGANAIAPITTPEAVLFNDGSSLNDLVGNLSLTTSSKTLTGAVNELNNKLNGIHIYGGVSTDLNTVTTPGFYRLNPTCTNAPSGYDHGQMLVTYGGSDTISQMVFPYARSEIWLRNGNTVNNSSGTWKPWTFIGDKAYAFYKFPASQTFDANTTTRNYTLTVTTHGRPVFIIVSGDLNPLNAGAWFHITFYRNNTEISYQICQSSASSYNIPFCMQYLDVVAAGTYSYKVQFVRGAGEFTLTESKASQSPNFTVFEI